MSHYVIGDTFEGTNNLFLSKTSKKRKSKLQNLSCFTAFFIVVVPLFLVFISGFVLVTSASGLLLHFISGLDLPSHKVKEEIDESGERKKSGIQEENSARKCAQSLVVQLTEHRIAPNRSHRRYDGKDGEDLAHLVRINALGQERPYDGVLAVAHRAQAEAEVELPQGVGEG